MQSRPLSQLTDNELLSLLRSTQSLSGGSREERYLLDRLASSLGVPSQGTKTTLRDAEIITKSQCEHDFSKFVEAAFAAIEPETEFISNWHITAVCNHLVACYDGVLENLIINVPPGSMKSLITSVFFPAWVWIHDPSQRFMHVSYDQQLSTRDSQRCRALIQSDWYRNLWGDVYRMAGDLNRQMKFQNNHGGWRIATSTAGRGMGEHPHWLMVDDANDTRKAHSEVALRAVREDWWDGAMSSRGRMLKGHHRIVTQQRVAVKDLTGHVLTKHGGDATVLKDPGKWHHLILPMEFEEELKCRTPIFEDPRSAEGQLLWPTGFDADLVAAIKIDMGPLTAAGQLQQRPTVAGGTLFKSEWMTTIEGLATEWLAPVFGRAVKPLDLGAIG